MNSTLLELASFILFGAAADPLGACWLGSGRARSSEGGHRRVLPVVVAEGAEVTCERLSAGLLRG